MSEYANDQGLPGAFTGKPFPPLPEGMSGPEQGAAGDGKRTFFVPGLIDQAERLRLDDANCIAPSCLINGMVAALREQEALLSRSTGSEPDMAGLVALIVEAEVEAEIAWLKTSPRKANLPAMQREFIARALRAALRPAPPDDTIVDSPSTGMTRHSAPGPRVNDPRHPRG